MRWYKTIYVVRIESMNPQASGSVLIEIEHLVQSAHMALFSAELGSQERIHDLVRNRAAGDSRAKSENVDVVVFDRLMSRVGVGGLSRANPLELVRRDAGTCTGTANDDASIRAIRDYGAAHRGREIGIVDGLCGIGAEIDHGVSVLGEAQLQFFFEVKASVIGTERDSHRILQR